MPGAIRHRDWDVSVRHGELIRDNWPAGVNVKRPEIRKTIPGLSGRRISEQIKSGIWMKPLGSMPGKTFSCVRDVGRRTLMLFVEGSTTGMSTRASDYEVIRDLVRELFHDRRVTGLDGEMYSRVTLGTYDIDDKVSRQYDIDMIEITTWFREDRTHSA